MKVSTMGTYSLRIMAQIAKESQDNTVTVSYLAEHTNISEKYLEKIVNKLLKAGLLISFRGASGGYKLSRPADSISVREILSATEGDMRSVSCMEAGATGELDAKCLTVNLWAGLNKVINDYLSGISLDDVINRKIVNKK